MIKKLISRFIFRVQILLLVASRTVSLIVFKGNPKINSWVVGTTETAKTVLDLSKALPGSVSVNLNRHRFYDQVYTYSCNSRNAGMIFGPILLGYLSSRMHRFMYVGSDGYLMSDIDFREREFRLLRKWGCKIACFQVGSEIRSLKKLSAWGKINDVETVATAAELLYTSVHIERNEFFVEKRAEVIDRYAHIVFNSQIDQMSYLKSEALPNCYLVDDSYFLPPSDKFKSLTKIVVCHAPSNPKLKGTAEIRNSIQILIQEGFDIEYVEFLDTPHEEVLEGLTRAHIVVNELFSMMPGVFAIEALSHRCVLLTSADPRYEQSIKWFDSPAWFVTNRMNILQNLRWCLSNREKLEEISEAGWLWAWENASCFSKSKWLINKLDQV